jgi:tetratricopeptide (TPR) repeat protein
MKVNTMMRLRLFMPLILTMLLIIYIGSQTNFITGIMLFVTVVLLPSSYITYVNYGSLLVMRGDLRGAIAHYGRLLRLPVNKIFVYTRRGALRNAIGDIDGAIADYTAAMNASKQEIPALYGMRSTLYLGKRDYEKALADSDHLLKLQPNSEIAYANRAAARMFMGDIEGAIADCDTGLESKSQQHSASGKALLYNNRGTAYRIQGNFGEAMANYNLAMSAGLDAQQKRLIHPKVMTNQGILYYLMQELENARVYFQQALDTNPSFYKAIAGLAVTRFKLGQNDEARKLWKNLMALEPRYRDVRVLQVDLNLPMQMMADVSDLMEAARG